MCSIFGLINISKNNYKINDLLIAMNHRGPDDNGIYKKTDDHTKSNSLKFALL